MKPHSLLEILIIIKVHSFIVEVDGEPPTFLIKILIISLECSAPSRIFKKKGEWGCAFLFSMEGGMG